jgi:hypothetical protein
LFSFPARLRQQTRLRQQISSEVKTFDLRWNKISNAWQLETTNLSALQRIEEFARGRFHGMKSVELKLWSRALYYQSSSRAIKPNESCWVKAREKSNERFEKIRNIMRKLKSRHKLEKADIIPSRKTKQMVNSLDNGIVQSKQRCLAKKLVLHTPNKPNIS